MKRLAQHIELLLRDNDCVILPGFGGFIAHDVPAYYVSEEGEYYPPSRSLSFNATITMNDGLLAQSYMKSYQVDYARANYMIDVAVEQLADMLDEEGSVTLPRIGVLTQDIHQSLQFTPDAAGIASPTHFGLGSLSIKTLSLLNQRYEPASKPKAIATSTTGKTINLHINREMLRHAMSTAAVFLLLIMVALPTGNHRPTDIAALNVTELITTPQTTELTASTIVEVMDSVAAPIVEPTPLVAEVPVVSTQEATSPVAIEEAPAVEEVPSVEMPAAPSVAPTKTYHIIVASLPSHRGAEETLAQYVNQGYTTASLVERDDRVRISLLQFADKAEANEYLKTLRQNEKFQNAWLLAVRN